MGALNKIIEAETSHWIVFYLEKQTNHARNFDDIVDSTETFYAFSIKNVIEVFTNMELMSIPVAVQGVCGVIYWRGHIVTTIDIRKNSGLEVDYSTKKTGLIVQLKQQVIAVLVENVEGIVKLKESDINYSPKRLKNSSQNHIKGMSFQDDRTFILLDLNEFILNGMK